MLSAYQLLISCRQESKIRFVSRVKELIAEGNVRRLIIRQPNGNVLLEVPLTAGVAVGGVVTLLNPVMAALGALAALLVDIKVEIIREKNIDE